jgi:hypothetical protein
MSNIIFFYTSFEFRLEQNESLTDPLKKIELFKAIASPAYIIALLEDFNEIREELVPNTTTIRHVHKCASSPLPPPHPC